MSDGCSPVVLGWQCEPLTFWGIAFRPWASSAHLDRLGTSLPGDLTYLTFEEYVRPRKLMSRAPGLGMFADSGRGRAAVAVQPWQKRQLLTWWRGCSPGRNGSYGAPRGKSSLAGRCDHCMGGCRISSTATGVLKRAAGDQRMNRGPTTASRSTLIARDAATARW